MVAAGVQFLDTRSLASATWGRTWGARPQVEGLTEDFDDSGILHQDFGIPGVWGGIVWAFDELDAVALVGEWARRVDNDVRACFDCIFEGFFGFEVRIDVHG